MKWDLKYFLLSCLTILSLLCIRSEGDNLAVLSSSMRNFEKISCDEDLMTLSCPATTTISTEAAQYLKIPSEEVDSVQCSSLTSKAKSYFSIMDVLYGRNQTLDSCQWPNSLQYSLLQMVVSVCQKKSNCRIQTSPRNIGDGDPCPNVRKFVRVSFKCRPTEFKTLVACEDEMAEIRCNRSFRAVVLTGRYGRKEYENVACHQPQGIPDETCSSEGTTAILVDKCHGKRSCSLKASRSIFATTSSCINPDTRSYLKVTYTCVPRRILKEEFQGELEPDEQFGDEEENTEGQSQIPPPVLQQPSISGAIKSTPPPEVINPNRASQAGSNSQLSSPSPSLVFYVTTSLSILILVTAFSLTLKFILLRKRRLSSETPLTDTQTMVSGKSEGEIGEVEPQVTSSGGSEGGVHQNQPDCVIIPAGARPIAKIELQRPPVPPISSVSAKCHDSSLQSYDIPLLECDFCGGCGGALINSSSTGPQKYFEDSSLIPPAPPPPLTNPGHRGVGSFHRRSRPDLRRIEEDPEESPETSSVHVR